MNSNITTTPEFAKSLKKLAKRYKSIKEDYRKFLAELKDNPQIGVDLGHNVHKVRMAIASKNKGKSGGARVIYHTILVKTDSANITLLTIYDKSDQESISDNEILSILKSNGLD